MFEKILVCLDGSILAEQILSLVEAQAKKFNSKVILLQVVPLTATQIIGAGATYTDAGVLAEQEQIGFDKAALYLENVSLMFKSKSIPVQAVVIKSAPVGRAILTYAGENGVDLIAIATHGHGGFGRMVFGSVADYILRESGLPMLVIRPRKS
jgi:nucleotide-binding universal stress UspA family protein